MRARPMTACSLWVAFALSTPCFADTAPRRIVSTAPSLTETLFALGAGDRVVGVTTWCRYPEEARLKPKIGGFSNPSLEAIAALRPDLVVLAEGRRDLADRLARFEIPTLAVSLESLRAIEDAIGRIASRLGVPERGAALVAGIDARRAAVARLVAGYPRPRTILLLGHSPDSGGSLFAVGPASFLGEMLEAAGGENVLGDVRVPYPKVSVEEVIARDPDVILEVVGPPADVDAQGRALRLWSAYPSLRAVRTGAVRVVVDDTIVQPGPRVGEKIEVLAHALHALQP
jgi:ABC-type Fe3+-hydroxamate transport system substrate-binding protein